MTPPDVDPSEGHPLIFRIDGGPHVMDDVGFRLDLQELPPTGTSTRTRRW